MQLILWIKKVKDKDRPTYEVGKVVGRMTTALPTVTCWAKGLEGLNMRPAGTSWHRHHSVWRDDNDVWGWPSGDTNSSFPRAHAVFAACGDKKLRRLLKSALGAECRVVLSPGAPSRVQQLVSRCAQVMPDCGETHPRCISKVCGRRASPGAPPQCLVGGQSKSEPASEPAIERERAMPTRITLASNLIWYLYSLLESIACILFVYVCVRLCVCVCVWFVFVCVWLVCVVCVCMRERERERHR
jgi:hypothetical protein